MVSGTILEEANRIVEGARSSDYGSPVENWNKVARVWSEILDFEIHAEDAVRCMVALKLVRESHKHKRDNLVDLCGYARILEMIEDAESKSIDIDISGA